MLLRGPTHIVEVGPLFFHLRERLEDLVFGGWDGGDQLLAVLPQTYNVSLVTADALADLVDLQAIFGYRYTHYLNF